MENLLREKEEEEKEVILNNVNTPSFMASLNTPFEALASPRRPSTASFFGCFSSKNKRVLGDQLENQESCVDRRYKRMMKNRESAATSRARRQAYISELERKIAELLEENANLRKHQFELMLSAQVETPKKMTTNHRSLTAPF